jgi:hypothetical protein
MLNKKFTLEYLESLGFVKYGLPFLDHKYAYPIIASDEGTVAINVDTSITPFNFTLSIMTEYDEEVRKLSTEAEEQRAIFSIPKFIRIPLTEVNLVIYNRKTLEETIDLLEKILVV